MRFPGIVLALCLAVGISAQAQMTKEALIAKYVETAASLKDKDVSGRMEVGIDMMGSVQKMPMKFWKKGKMARMEITVTSPLLPEPMEQLMVCDGAMLWTYQKVLNTVTSIDMNRLSEEMRGSVQSSMGPFSMGAMTKNLDSFVTNSRLSEMKRDGKNYYVLQMANLGDVTKNLPGPFARQMSAFKKINMWIDPSTYYVSRVDFFADAEQPGMWLDINSVNFQPVDPSLFVFKVPEGAQVNDMTDTVIGMYNRMNQPATPPTP